MAVSQRAASDIQPIFPATAFSLPWAMHQTTVFVLWPDSQPVTCARACACAAGLWTEQLSSIWSQCQRRRSSASGITAISILRPQGGRFVSDHRTRASLICRAATGISDPRPGARDRATLSQVPWLRRMQEWDDHGCSAVMGRCCLFPTKHSIAFRSLTSAPPQMVRKRLQGLVSPT